VCVAVFGGEPFEAPAEWGSVVLTSAPMDGRSVPPAAAAWLA
jgi:hypothetical protein